jgi:hypothetical protein
MVYDDLPIQNGDSEKMSNHHWILRLSWGKMEIYCNQYLNVFNHYRRITEQLGFNGIRMGHI